MLIQGCGVVVGCRCCSSSYCGSWQVAYGTKEGDHMHSASVYIHFLGKLNVIEFCLSFAGSFFTEVTA